MRATVIRDFRGVEEMLREYHAGDEFEGTEERVSFLAARGFVEPAEERPTPRKRARKKAAE